MRLHRAFLRLFSVVLVLTLLLCIPALSHASEESSIILTFTGDCTLGNTEGLNNKSYSFVNVIKQHGFDYPFKKVQDLFATDDLTVINLENVFFDKNNNKSSKTYNFRSPTSYAAILKQGSVELAFIGNNHVMDYGPQGFESTRQALEDHHIPWFGSVRGYPAHYIFEKDGIKIGFFGTLPAYFLQSREELSQTIATLKDAGCEVIVGVIHAGTEYSWTRDRTQHRMARWMVNNGADLIIGHHPHIPQGMDIMGHASVLYSLGNFSFGGNHRMTVARRGNIRADKAIVARVELKFDADKKYLGHQVNIIPVSPSGEYDANNYQPVVLTGEEAEKTIQMVQRDTAFVLNPYVEGVGAVQEFIINTRDSMQQAAED
ncbi:MAG: CapA family protein [Clostridiales bacterium]|nr:CapA family protein [Clostridiales bacterium]